MHLKKQLQGAHTDKSKANVCGTKPFLINSNLLSGEAPDGCLCVLTQTQYKCEIICSVCTCLLCRKQFDFTHYMVPNLKSRCLWGVIQNTKLRLKVKKLKTPSQPPKLVMVKCSYLQLSSLCLTLM